MCTVTHTQTYAFLILVCTATNIFTSAPSLILESAPSPRRSSTIKLNSNCIAYSTTQWSCAVVCSEHLRPCRYIIQWHTIYVIYMQKLLEQNILRSSNKTFNLPSYLFNFWPYRMPIIYASGFFEGRISQIINYRN